MTGFFLDLACALWVGSAILGWWQGANATIAQLGLWTLASIPLIAAGMCVHPKRGVHPVFGFLIAGCFLTLLFHWNDLGIAQTWAITACVILSAAFLAAERGTLAFLERCLVAFAWFQIPVMLLQFSRVKTPWPPDSAIPPWGTLGSRGALSILLGTASILSDGMPAWILAGFSALSFSFSGAIPAFLRLFSPRWRRERQKTWILVPAVVAVGSSWSVWFPRLAVRWQEWTELLKFHPGWLFGWGFLPLPTGFEPTVISQAKTVVLSSVFRTAHCTWLEWVFRTGLVGAAMLASFAAWAWVSSSGKGRWLLFLLFWAGCWQSFSALPSVVFIGVLFVCLASAGRFSRFNIQKTGGDYVRPLQAVG